jgi:hypothetical protein
MYSSGLRETALDRVLHFRGLCRRDGDAFAQLGKTTITGSISAIIESESLPVKPLNLHHSLAGTGRPWHICNRNFVISKLREHEQLKAAGIVYLRLHGSLSRGTATASSDVDLMAEVDATKHLVSKHSQGAHAQVLQGRDFVSCEWGRKRAFSTLKVVLEEHAQRPS